VLKIIAAAAAVGVGCGGKGGVAPDPVGDLAAGNVSDLSVGSLKAVGVQPVCIGRDAAGVYAMTLTCTHSGCNMATDGSVTGGGISCACHGSRFDANGGVVQGPASDPLQHFAVSADASGNLTIHGGSEVDASTRLKV
jgi:Rieske Fe-S protein